jgi:pimeloyl-ACP methyl ester carboxylesterase
MPYTEAPGFRQYFEEHGSGFPLLLINGLGSDHLEWLHQLPTFSERFRVIVFDNRGTGKSAVPPGPYTTAQMADDAAALLRFLGIGRAHVLGVSLGGMIAQEVALRHPDLVEGVVLGCTGAGGNLSVRPSPEAMAAFALAKGEDPEGELRRMIPFLYSEAGCRERPEEIEGFIRRRLGNPTPPEGYAAQLAAAMTHDASGRLSRIRARTLVITGDADRLVNWENSRRIAGRIPGARLVVLPGAPHRLFAEDPDAFNREVLRFLQSGT